MIRNVLTRSLQLGRTCTPAVRSSAASAGFTASAGRSMHTIATTQRRALQRHTQKNLSRMLADHMGASFHVARYSTEADAHATGAAEKHSFQAETRELLDIVAHSLYTDKDVFIRELISNASDALEKLRHHQATGQEVLSPEEELAIHITVDEENKTLTIRDTGIGMTKGEVAQNLGTIAHSGSKNFVRQMKASAEAGDGKSSAIIGQFGVGFYSAFMVSDDVTVYTQSYTGGDASMWKSSGTGEYELAPAEGVTRGTTIVIKLKDDQEVFSTKAEVERVIKQYSNFVGYPIYVNGDKINTIQPLWTVDQSTITKEMHNDFYRFLAHAWDEPMFHFHFKTDSPIEIRSLFYFPTMHAEKFGLGRQEPGVNLYSRKVLIEGKSAHILPDWLRFVKGAVDSEDIPLNISRESMQDSSLIRKMNNALTKRIIKFLDEQAKKDAATYEKFFREFGDFLKEGVCTDFKHMGDIAKLLRFNTSSEEEKIISLDDYISRMTPEQTDIYYLAVPNRRHAIASPYYEAFKENGEEVLFLHQTIDDFVMNNLKEYKGRKLVSIESGIAPPTSAKKDETEEDKPKLDEVKASDLSQWLQGTLEARVASVKTTSRLRGSPAIITDHDSAAVRRMMQLVDANRGDALPKQNLEINPSHPIIMKLNDVKDSDPELAKKVAEQVFDNALVAAGLLDDSRSMLPRLNEILEAALKK
eukprot:GFYU01004111.1.p1 GENE.GFYU01004111.1~~GFYU01004111.1.p1  ORF type:complete len:700 (+),score=253.42 GFYU01004111.1:79-2178(+)